jgi:hypothetical protein
MPQYIGAASTEWISENFDVKLFYENLQGNPDFFENQAKVLGILHEDLSVF